MSFPRRALCLLLLGAACDSEVRQPRASFEEDVLPLFTREDVWFTSAAACNARGCHHAVDEYPGTESAHELDMGTHEGILTGADGGEEPIVFTGMDPDGPDYWKNSPLRARLRNNRMPLGIPPAVPRDGPPVSDVAPLLGWDDAETRSDPSGVVKIVEAWLAAGVPPGTFDYSYDVENGQARASIQVTKSFERDVLPLFTTAGLWYPGAESCHAAGCHNGAGGRHDLDMGSYDGILRGADDGEEPIVYAGQDPGRPHYWKDSPLRKRLRNNRMPWGVSPLVPRDGPRGEVLLIDDWLAAGAPEGEFPTSRVTAPAEEGEAPEDEHMH